MKIITYNLLARYCNKTVTGQFCKKNCYLNDNCTLKNAIKGYRCISSTTFLHAPASTEVEPCLQNKYIAIVAQKEVHCILASIWYLFVCTTKNNSSSMQNPLQLSREMSEETMQAQVGSFETPYVFSNCPKSTPISENTP